MLRLCKTINVAIMISVIFIALFLSIPDVYSGRSTYQIAYDFGYQSEIEGNTGGIERAKGMPCDPEGVLNQPSFRAILDYMVRDANLSGLREQEFRRGFRQGFIDAYKKNYYRQ